MNNLHLILGSPGCGKTTRLLNIVDDALQSGIHPMQIGFVSFTRKAANEAAGRACEKFGLERTDLPYFRTLHSCAYRALGLEKRDVLNDYRPIAAALGLNFDMDTVSANFLPSGTGRHREIPFLEALARNRCIDLHDQWHDWQAENPDGYLDWHILDLYRDLGLYDYTDILKAFVTERLNFPVRLLIIDEAQDLSRLQWELVKCASKSVEKIILAGDDDQCIYQWAGADIETFLNVPGTREVLQQSHRLPRAVFNKAQEIVQRIGHRYAKVWRPRADEGEHNEYGTLDAIPIHPEETYMFLARNHYHLRQVKQHLRDTGYFFETTGRETSVDTAYLAAIHRWEALRKGEALPVEEIKKVYSLIRIGHGLERGARGKLENHAESTHLTISALEKNYGLKTRAIWHDALTGIPLDDREYIVACLRNGEKLNRPPRIYVGTIHSVKGGEADNVVLIPDLSNLSWKSYTNNEDIENRVLYVAVTRAKQRLMTLFPQTPRYYYV
jgi:DNA helicase-2/ATP-dependent DNA helicase PcrA